MLPLDGAVALNQAGSVRRETTQVPTGVLLIDP